MPSEVVKLAPSQLPRYDEMCRAIEAATEVDEVLEIKNRAAALALYARQARNFENEKLCVIIRIRAERRCGALLLTMEKARGAPGNQFTGPLARDEGSKTLAQLGISWDQSASWQRLARYPLDDFEEALRVLSLREGRLLTTGHVSEVCSRLERAAYDRSAEAQQPQPRILRIVELKEERREIVLTPDRTTNVPANEISSSDAAVGEVIAELELLSERFGPELLRAAWAKFSLRFH